MSANQAFIAAIIGATGSGKSSYVKWTLLKPAAMKRRLLVWDFKREYRSLVTAETDDISAFTRMACAGPSFRLAFLPSFDSAIRAKQFGLFCKLAYGLGDVTMVIEELAFVTTPSWAPPAWSMVSLTGRHEGLRVIACSQRPASIDKNFFGNCNLIHCGRVQDKNDVKTMAAVLFSDPAELMQLNDLEYIQRDTRTRQNTRGKVRIPANV